jgi:hypothetical protein
MNETNKKEKTNREKTKKTGTAKACARRGLRALLLAAALLPLLAAALFWAPAASAAGPVALSVKQTFAIVRASSATPDGSFRYRLSPEAGSPALADDGVFQIAGNEEIPISVAFAADVGPGGPYGYTLRCETPARSYYALDGQVYRVNVYVTNRSQTLVNVYRADAYADRGEAADKVDFANFAHSYEYGSSGGGGGGGGGETTPQNPTPAEPDPGDNTETTDPEDPAEPAPGETVPNSPPAPTVPGHTLVPGENGAFIELDENGTPLGEWRWDEDEGRWIFDAYPPLAQTGQLLWPVPVMGVSGALLFLFGLFLSKRRERNESPAARASLGVRAGE